MRSGSNAAVSELRVLGIVCAEANVVWHLAGGARLKRTPLDNDCVSRPSDGLSSGRSR